MKIFKLLHALFAFLMIALAVLPTVVANAGLEGVPIVDFTIEHLTMVMSLVIVAWVVNSFLASLVSQGSLSISSITVALKEVAQGEAFTRAEERLAGDMTIKQVADTISSGLLLIPKDSELYNLFKQVQLTLVDLYDGLEEGDKEKIS